MYKYIYLSNKNSMLLIGYFIQTWLTYNKKLAFNTKILVCPKTFNSNFCTSILN